MPEKETRERAKADKRRGNSASTQAGEYVREEIHHIREGKHGAKNAKQAIAIGLSRARRDGVDIPPKKGAAKSTKAGTKKDSESATSKSRVHKPASPKRASAATSALKKETSAAASHEALSRQAKKTARSHK